MAVSAFLQSPMLRLASAALLAACMSTPAFARAQVDLSVRVEMTPTTFVAGGHNRMSVTVHNAGPDDAGTTFPDEKPIRRYSNTLVFPASQEPVYEIAGVSSGDCWLDVWSEPWHDGNWIMQFICYFDPIASGESHTCTSDVHFSTQAPERIGTFWWVNSANDTDVTPGNNRVDYTFIMAPEPAAPVPALSLSWVLLGAGLLSIVAAAHVRAGRRRRCARLVAERAGRR